MAHGMQICRVSTRISVSDGGVWKVRLPAWIKGKRVHRFDRKPDGRVVEVVADKSTGALIAETPLKFPVALWQCEALRDTAHPEHWQHVILIEAQRQIEQARTKEEGRVIATAAAFLVRFGKQRFNEIRDTPKPWAKDGLLTLGQLHNTYCQPAKGKAVSLRLLQRQVKKGVIPASCIERTPGGQCRIRLNADFFWWQTKQDAWTIARQLCEKHPPGENVIPVTPEALNAHRHEVVGSRKSELLDLVRAAMMEAHQGMNLKDIIKNPHPLLTTPLPDLPARLFKAVGKGREMAVLQVMGDLASRHQKITQKTIARGLGVSLATFKRSHLEFYRKWLSQLDEKTTLIKDGRAKTLREEDILQESPRDDKVT